MKGNRFGTHRLVLATVSMLFVISALIATPGLSAAAPAVTPPAQTPVTPPTSAPASPAANGSTTCSGSNNGSGALINCNRGGPTKGWSTVPGWRVVSSYTNQPCVDSNGNTSYRGDLVNGATGATLPGYCLVAHKPVGGQIVDQKDLLIKAPMPTADFNDRFLTGAEIMFTAPQLIDYAQTLQLFPGATVVANPVKMLWDFGDGTTSAEQSPKHTYTTKSPDPQNPDDHTVHVTVTGTWHLYLHPADNAPVQDLGEVALTGQMARPIVAVWSAPTEPNTNV